MRYLRQLEQQLVGASRELSAAGSGSSATKRISRFRALGQRHTVLSAAAAVLALAATSGAIAAAVLGFPDLTAPSPLGQAQAVPSELTSSFAVLRRDRRAGDALPTKAIGGTPTGSGDLVRHWGINVKLSRLAGVVDGERIWLVPGNVGSCIGLADGSGACGPNKLVAVQGLVLMLVPVSGVPVTFIGVLPDGAWITATDVNGSHHRVTSAGAAFRISRDPDLRDVTIHKHDGTTVKLRAR